MQFAFLFCRTINKRELHLARRTGPPREVSFPAMGSGKVLEAGYWSWPNCEQLLKHRGWGEVVGRGRDPTEATSGHGQRPAVEGTGASEGLKRGPRGLTRGPWGPGRQRKC